MNPITINMPDDSDLTNKTSTMVQKAEAFTIASVEDQARAHEEIKFHTAMERQVIELFKDPKTHANKAHKSITGAEKKLLAPIQMSKQILSRKSHDWDVEQRRKADEERQRLEAEAMQQEEDRILAEAAAVEKDGDKVGAQEILEQEVEVPVIHVEPQVAKTQGVGGSNRYEAELTDLHELVKYVAERPEWVSLLQPAMPQLNALARTQKEMLRIPGIKVTKKWVASIRLTQ